MLKKVLPASTKARPNGYGKAHKEMNKQEKWRSTRKKRKVLTCSSQDAKREEEAAWSGMATALSKDGAGVVGVTSGGGGVGARMGDTTRAGEVATSRRGLVMSPASL